MDKILLGNQEVTLFLPLPYSVRHKEISTSIKSKKMRHLDAISLILQHIRTARVFEQFPVQLSFYQLDQRHFIALFANTVRYCWALEKCLTP